MLFEAYSKILKDCEFKAMNDSQKLQIQKNFIFRAHHRRLCSPPFCSAQLGKNFKKRCDNACERINVTLASETCSNLVPAVKTIRFTDFRRITDLVLNNYDARIVFLVRDPRLGSKIFTIQLAVLKKTAKIPFKRGVYNSMIQLNEARLYGNYDKVVWDRVKDTCNRTVANLDFLASNAKMRKHTLLVRYEDMALDPQGYAKKVYEFTGLEFYGEGLS